MMHLVLLLKSQGITDLVLDLRYNGGESVQTATRLASMITGQFSRSNIFSRIITATIAIIIPIIFSK
jgi:C-terminal processing protease CtpA/Prc